MAGRAAEAARPRGAGDGLAAPSPPPSPSSLPADDTEGGLVALDPELEGLNLPAAASNESELEGLNLPAASNESVDNTLDPGLEELNHAPAASCESIDNLPPAAFKRIDIKFRDFTTITALEGGKLIGHIWTPDGDVAKERRKKGRGGVAKEAQIAELQQQLRAAERKASAAAGEAERRIAVAEELRVVREREYSSQREQMRRLAAAAAAKHGRAGDATNAKVETLKGQLAAQVDIVQKHRAKIKEMVHADVAAGLQEQLDGHFKLHRLLEDGLRELQSEMEDKEDEAAELQTKLEEATATAGPGRGSFAEGHAPQQVEQLRKDVGLRAGYCSVPPRTSDTDTTRRASVKHMAAVLEDRGEGADINLVADALYRAGYLERLILESERAQPIVKGIIGAAIGEVQAHWTPRHAVHVWDRLGPGPRWRRCNTCSRSSTTPSRTTTCRSVSGGIRTTSRTLC